MKFEIEFFRRTLAEPTGVPVRRHIGDFADIKAAEAYGLSNTGIKNAPDELDGFRIYVDGMARKTVSIRAGYVMPKRTPRPETPAAVAGMTPRFMDG